MKKLSLSKIFVAVIILGVIEGMIILYSGFEIQKQTTIFGIETYLLIPLASITACIRLAELVANKKDINKFRAITLVLYGIISLVTIISLTVSFASGDEDTIYSIMICICALGLIIYDVASSKSYQRLEDLF